MVLLRLIDLVGKPLEKEFLYTFELLTPFTFPLSILLFLLLAPEPVQVGEHVITQKGLYTALFVIGIPMLWWSSPFLLIFWLIGSSAFVVLGHASFIEPPVSSEYSGVEQV